jgi:predicted histidine transporter YuiF (NhaC family)
MVITWQTIITAGAVLGAVGVIFGLIFKAYGWYMKQQTQDTAIAELKKHHEEDMKQVREENRLICYALSACLDGLMQLGANHTVPDAKTALDKYLNQQAHK